MATQPIDTAKVYALTAAGACSVTLTQGEKTITWDALSRGGQTSFVVPAGATAEISDPTAILSPLPANFKAALGAGAAHAEVIGGKPMEGEQLSTAAADEQGACMVDVRHATWSELSGATITCNLKPSSAESSALSMTLMLTPSQNMTPGWLTSAAQIVWLYGEPVILSGHTYLIGITQIAPDKILANLLATF